ncbi:putative lipid II flippase FtsW [Gordonia insulae]|uniref:Probable peptidoglycan glycosyltransferase FtsW n=1 Tax=Gordonia insulae TaxID=2420509 RepID=A0A3G8JGH1_9ACTN|nr:putative lipid II flippase FtsW [Gordonia insulae]AZG43705.1 putative peptidoglycan glycosyltransferase FtsW [Gordonia insulae]
MSTEAPERDTRESTRAASDKNATQKNSGQKSSTQKNSTQKNSTQKGSTGRESKQKDSATTGFAASWPAAVLEAVRNLLSRPLASYHLILTIAFLLTAFGLVMVLSASSVEGYSQNGSSYGLFATQVIFALLGLLVFYVMLRVPVRLLRRAAAPLMVVTTILLALVLIPGIGTLSQGARRWFVIGGLSVQPSELVKVALCVWGAHLLASRRKENASLKELLIPLLPVALLVCVLIVLEPNLSTTITIAIIVGALLWFAGLPVKVFLTFAAVGTAIAVLLALVEGYRSQRVLSFLGSIDDPQGAGYQARQATYALANGGVFGVGLGQSRAKWNYLPNAHNDFIFAIIGEELGLIGGLLVVMLFAILAFIGFRIAVRSVDPFLRLMTATITVLITAQAFINIGYVIGLLPVTGIQLPLLSAGGTSTLTVLAMLGLLANAARHEPEAVAALTAGGDGRVGRWLRLPAPVAYRPTRADALRDRLDRRRPDRARGPGRGGPAPADTAPSRWARLRPGRAARPDPSSGRRSATPGRAPRTSAVRVDYRTGYSGTGGRAAAGSNRGGTDRGRSGHASRGGRAEPTDQWRPVGRSTWSRR